MTEQEQGTLNKGRLMRAESEILLPLLTTKQNLAVAKLVADFRAGKYAELTGHAAEISTIMGMREEITRSIKQAEQIETKLYGENSDE